MTHSSVKDRPGTWTRMGTRFINYQSTIFIGGGIWTKGFNSSDHNQYNSWKRLLRNKAAVFYKIQEQYLERLPILIIFRIRLTFVTHRFLTETRSTSKNIVEERLLPLYKLISQQNILNTIKATVVKLFGTNILSKGVKFLKKRFSFNRWNRV